MKENIIKAVEKHRELIFETQKFIWENPETGYREVKTSAYLENIFTRLGYSVVRAENIPGFYTVIDTGRPGPEILILAEMDSLICYDHPECDKETGAVHCCGHSAQSAALVGIAAALKEEGILEGLCGRIRLCAVPAEELIEIGYRSELKSKGIIKYFGGKPEFLSRGYFDGVDIAFMVHTAGGEAFSANVGSVGCIAKKVIYKGKAAHAGGTPWYGCNALYAANTGISAANALRETFAEPDIIRFHPIITSGGNAVNAIPDRVIVESYVRGKTFDAIKNANFKINRALIGGALSLGANVDITDFPGYAPLENCPGMIELARDAADALGVGFDYSERTGSGSTDMGDLSCIMPVIHPYVPGACGTSHGMDYQITDPEKACVLSAKWQLTMLELLLRNDGERAKKIKAEFTPRFASKEEYFAYTESM
ncbi:MAG: amidohydrolase, partial [Clostridia bacterium]|nr:amidohydrolase [Clostridia bacterium]